MEPRSESDSRGPLLSVIVPSRNPGSHIWDLIEWAVPPPDVEIIVVDDGSTDGSLEILQTHLTQQPQTAIYLVAGTGRSAGSARNTGLNRARGVYVAFSDCDDRTDVGALLKGAQLCQDSGADVTVCGYDRVDLVMGIRVRILPTGMAVSHDFKGAESLLDRSAVWGKIFRRSFLIDNGIFFSERLGAEDVRFSYDVARCRPKTVMLPKVAYEYRISREGQLTGTQTYFCEGARTLSDMLDSVPEAKWERALLAFTSLSSIPYVVRGIGGWRGIVEGVHLGALTFARLGPRATTSGFQLGVRNRIARRNSRI